MGREFDMLGLVWVHYLFGSSYVLHTLLGSGFTAVSKAKVPAACS